jgi:predicted nucleic acid-binding protein
MSEAACPVAVLDANVLYSASLRHLLISLAVAEAFDARWTDTIQDEWTRALLRDKPHLDARRIARTRQLMDAHVDDAIVTGYVQLIADLVLPDPDDRHVLAAAIHCGATIIVTKNLKDFPAAVLAPYGITAVPPDVVIDGARSHRSELSNPPRSPAEYLAALESDDLIMTAAALRNHIDEL